MYKPTSSNFLSHIRDCHQKSYPFLNIVLHIKIPIQLPIEHCNYFLRIKVEATRISSMFCISWILRPSKRAAQSSAFPFSLIQSILIISIAGLEVISQKRAKAAPPQGKPMKCLTFKVSPCKLSRNFFYSSNDGTIRQSHHRLHVCKVSLNYDH